MILIKNINMPMLLVLTGECILNVCQSCLPPRIYPEPQRTARERSASRRCTPELAFACAENHLSRE